DPLWLILRAGGRARFGSTAMKIIGVAGQLRFSYLAVHQIYCTSEMNARGGSHLERSPRKTAMIPTGQDSLHTRSTLEVAGKKYAYFSLNKAGETLGDVSRLPFSMKVLLENLLRFEDGTTVTRDDLHAMADWLKERRINREIQYRPARVLMQDFTGVPAVVD